MTINDIVPMLTVKNAESAAAFHARRLIFPVGDQPYGMRQGRVADPEGHRWLLGKPIEGS